MYDRVTKIWKVFGSATEWVGKGSIGCLDTKYPKPAFHFARPNALVNREAPPLNYLLPSTTNLALLNADHEIRFKQARASNKMRPAVFP